MDVDWGEDKSGVRILICTEPAPLVRGLYLHQNGGFAPVTYCPRARGGLWLSASNALLEKSTCGEFRAKPNLLTTCSFLSAEITWLLACRAGAISELPAAILDWGTEKAWVHRVTRPNPLSSHKQKAAETMVWMRYPVPIKSACFAGCLASGDPDFAFGVESLRVPSLCGSLRSFSADKTERFVFALRGQQSWIETQLGIDC